MSASTEWAGTAAGGAPGRRLKIRHATRVVYDGRAASSHNELRMTPLTLPAQTALDARIDIAPGVAPWSYWDYWGTQVTAFDLMEPHESLLIVATSLVETAPPPPLPAEPGWEEIARLLEASKLAEFGLPTPRTAVGEEPVARAREAAAGLGPHEAALAVAGLVRDRVAYLAGSTGVHTGAQEAWEQQAGVCQDITHLTVALLRRVGLPARYVSGYLHPDPDAPPHRPVAGESHAWVEYWAGGWVAYDPTNRARAGESHVVVARGREYGDVVPHKGVYHGAPSGPPQVEVEFTRLA
ncbi:transglutaminase family protein [Streptomyces sp. DSM 44917]|uniref:Transglutaminase family protein n=1 Tax=Streptomyces boetiae TaxID=3075541 RepID=A0ABU2L3L9_9ACTN|nr:transglutaminase family protein [Streptomyces sp. DSM 44917]MDT0306011.1 transglutaminase family protein [Streptomyces sp. DSM 44917]